MSLNDDNLRLLSDAEREAMEDDDKYDPDTDNAAALAALGRFPLDAEVEEESNDDAADAGNGMSGYRPGAHDGGPRGEAARQCRVRAHRWQRSVHRVQRAQRESRAPGHSHEEHGRHGAGQVHAGRGLDHVLVRIRQHSVQPGVRRHEPGARPAGAPCCSCPPRRWLASRPRCSATSGATPRSIYKDLRRERREESAGTSEWAKLWEHLQLGGGTTRYRDLHADPKDCAKALQRALDQVGARWLATAAHCWPGCRASMRPWKPQRAWASTRLRWTRASAAKRPLALPRTSR